ncbi:MAG: TonB-dependent receptor plug domain-containing protein, partial [Prevotellaceae bacterium]|nr:TonB-dependent receptor plug domain-containing protein [Prevotellaceae bacterium]
MRFLYALALSLLLVFPAVAQSTLSISGTVLDDTNEPVIGASVVLKGTSKGVITGTSGEYSIQAPSDGVLVFSFIGMGEKEEVINGRTQINVVLSESTNELDEVVVVGYGTMRKSDITGSLSSVKMEGAIKSTPVANITDALQGRLAGVSITSSSGAPGSGNTIRVRGVNSITGDGGPLVVVDGFIGGDLASLNPSDIASVEVLKDASATAIYGSRAASGVILVTTKNPDKGSAKITYNGYLNLKTPARLPKQLSPGENAQLQNSYLEERSGRTPAYSEQEIAALDNGGGYDYIDATFKGLALE